MKYGAPITRLGSITLTRMYSTSRAAPSSAGPTSAPLPSNLWHLAQVFSNTSLPGLGVVLPRREDVGREGRGVERGERPSSLAADRHLGVLAEHVQEQRHGLLHLQRADLPDRIDPRGGRQAGVRRDRDGSLDRR